MVTFANKYDQGYQFKVTPLMTVFAPKGNASTVLSKPEVNLQCMKPIEDDVLPYRTTAKGQGETLIVKNSWPAMLFASAGFLATAIFIG